MLTLIQVLAITGNKRKINKILPAVCGGQPRPPSWELFVLLRVSPSNQPSQLPGCREVKAWLMERQHTWRLPLNQSQLCLLPKHGTRARPRWIHPLRGAEPQCLLCFRSQTLPELWPGILQAVQWKEGGFSLLWCCWDFSPSVLAGGPKSSRRWPTMQLPEWLHCLSCKSHPRVS